MGKLPEPIDVTSETDILFNRMRTVRRAAFWTISVFFGLTILACFVYLTGSSAYEYVDDATITSKVGQIIAEDQDARFLKVDVDTTGGNVVLMGSVNSLETKERLISKIKMIKGVKSVRSLLKVKENK